MYFLYGRGVGFVLRVRCCGERRRRGGGWGGGEEEITGGFGVVGFRCVLVNGL